MATAVDSIAPFRNESIRTFSDPADRASIEAALGRARRSLGARYPLVIDGKPVESSETIRSHNPAKPSEVVGEIASASLEQAQAALAAASARFQTWRFVPAAERAGYLFRAAEIVRSRRDDFNALLVLEVGKTWIEADADTAEAIDFMEFYAREALRYAAPPALVPARRARTTWNTSRWASAS